MHTPQNRKPSSALAAAALTGLWLLSATGCRNPRTLETRSGLHENVSIQAQAIRAEKGWEISLPLPEGTWKIEPFEDQAYSLIPGDPASTLKWTVSQARWENHQKPFVLELVGRDGRRLPMTIRYPKPSGMDTVKKIGETILIMACWSGTQWD